MKKLVILFIAVLYMGAATGTTVHLHYCMEKLIGFDLTKNKGDKCGQCGMKAGKDCCKDEQKILKINTEHKASHNNFHFVKLLTAIVPYSPDIISRPYATAVILHPLANAPPYVHHNPIYLRNCVFLI